MIGGCNAICALGVLKEVLVISVWASENFYFCSFPLLADWSNWVKCFSGQFKFSIWRLKNLEEHENL